MPIVNTISIINYASWQPLTDQKTPLHEVRTLENDNLNKLEEWSKFNHTFRMISRG